MGVGEITRALHQLRSGDESAERELTLLVYPELRRLAARFMRRERPGHTLQATALVHEAYLRLAGQQTQEWQDRAHFFGVAANVMREILVDHARKQRSAKRGGGQKKIDFEEGLLVTSENADTVLWVDEALRRLEKYDARQCRVVEMRFFVGLTEVEIAQVLGIGARTVKRDWNMAKAWLHGELAKRASQLDP